MALKSGEGQWLSAGTAYERWWWWWMPMGLRMMNWARGWGEVRDGQALWEQTPGPFLERMKGGFVSAKRLGGERWQKEGQKGRKERPAAISWLLLTVHGAAHSAQIDLRCIHQLEWSVLILYFGSCYNCGRSIIFYSWHGRFMSVHTHTRTHTKSRGKMLPYAQNL